MKFKFFKISEKLKTNNLLRYLKKGEYLKPEIQIQDR